MSINLNNEQLKYLNDFCSKYNINIDLINNKEEIFKWLSGTAFYESGEKDLYERFFSKTPNFFHQKNLDDFILQSTGHLPKSTPVPEGYSFALCLTHDVDIVRRYPSWEDVMNFHQKNSSLDAIKSTGYKLIINSYCRKLVKHSLSYFKSDSLGCYEKWMEEEDKHGFKSSFLFFANPLEKAHFVDCDYSLNDKIKFKNKFQSVNSMMVEMHNSGWDVGLHGSYYSAIEMKYLADQKKRIEDIIQTNVVSTRQHYLHFNYQITPSYYHELGLKIDSTIGFNKGFGYATGTASPFYLWDFKNNRSTSVIELPMNFMDSSLFKATSTTKELDEIIKIGCNMIDDAVKNKSVLTFNFHPNYIILKDRWEVYKILLQEARNKKAWGCSMKELYNFCYNK